MTVLIWITEGTWPACVDIARTLAPPDADLVLLHVLSDDLPAAAHGAFAGLLGRGHPERDPGHNSSTSPPPRPENSSKTAARRLGRPARLEQRRGRVEHEVVAAAETADLLILARDGDRTSRGPATRFVVDHVPYPVLLVWPEPAMGIGSPPPSPHPPHHL